jgi:hypothetical protein
MVFAFPLNRRSSGDLQPPIEGARLLRLLPKTDGWAALEQGSARRKSAADRDCGKPRLRARPPISESARGWDCETGILLSGVAP